MLTHLTIIQLPQNVSCGYFGVFLFFFTFKLCLSSPPLPPLQQLQCTFCSSFKWIKSCNLTAQRKPAAHSRVFISKYMCLHPHTPWDYYAPFVLHLFFFPFWRIFGGRYSMLIDLNVPHIFNDCIDTAFLVWLQFRFRGPTLESVRIKCVTLRAGSGACFCCKASPSRSTGASFQFFYNAFEVGNFLYI